MKIGDMHFQNLHIADRKGFQLCCCDTSLHAKHVKQSIAFAVLRVEFDLSAILYESNMGTEAFCNFMCPFQFVNL